MLELLYIICREFQIFSLSGTNELPAEDATANFPGSVFVHGDLPHCDAELKDVHFVIQEPISDRGMEQTGTGISLNLSYDFIVYRK